MPQPAPSAGRHWIKASTLAALINTAMGLGALLLAHALGATKPDAGTFAKTTVFLTYFFASGAGVAIFATLTGRVLREKLPDFPLGSWITLHLVVGLLLGIVAGFGALQPPPDASQLSHVMPVAWIVISIGALIGGAIVGLVVGSFQAFIMRHAAHGLGAWIGFWALAAVLGVLVYGGLFFMAKPLTSMTGEIITQGLGFLSAIVTSLVMLPALARLTPRRPAV
jgi:hypothetical protein